VRGDAARRLGVALATTCAGALPVFLTSALIVQIAAELDFELERLGIAVGLYFLAGVGTSILMGRLTEHLGPATALRLGGTLSAFCLFLIALATDLTSLCACLFLGGVCNALCQPAANLYVTRTISPTRRGLALALKQSAIPAATLVGGLAVPLVALTIGWRWSFVLCALAAGATAALVPQVAVTMPPSEGDSAAAGAPLRAMLLLAATVGFGAAGAGCLASFAVAGATRIGVGNASAGWLVAFGSALAIATRVSLGYRADLRGGGHLAIVGWMLLLGAVGAIGLRSQGAWLFVGAVPLVFSAGWGWPGLFNLAVISHNPSAPGAATGFTQTGTYLGAALGPMMFGLIADRSSWTTAWSTVSIFFVLGAIAAALARSELRRLQAAPPR
jgi:predicted MFS family arabinose efflux permease